MSHDTEVAHTSRGSARIEHTGRRDWSFAWREHERVRKGDLFEITAWAKIEGGGRATLCATIRDAGGEVMDWVFAGRSLAGTSDWKRLRSRFVVPEGVADVEARLIGNGPATVWMDDFSFRKTGNVVDMWEKDMPGKITIGNRHIEATFAPREGVLSVLDRRTKQRWRQRSFADALVLKAARRDDEAGRRVALELFDVASDLDVRVKLEIEPNSPEFTVELSAEGELQSPVRFPPAFEPVAGTYLVIPMNEGVSYPVDDESIKSMRLIAYGGHGICMAFWGATDGERGRMAILETPDDAALRIARTGDGLVASAEWDPQKGRFGYARRVRYVFFDRGGHVAICKRYRAYAKGTGLLKTLAEKRARNPNVDLLIGAANIWCWERDAVAIVREMQAAGIERILWSHRGSPDTVRAMNLLGVLTSRYDIYQDVMDPANFKLLRNVHPDWPTEAWPKDLMRDSLGRLVHGWQVVAKDGKRYPCGVLCDLRAPDYAKARIADELKETSYRSRFIDTTTASPWRECYDPAHPMTRTESRRSKMALLRVVSEEMKLVTGCETGHDASVPYVHYFEGMLSLGPYRVPEAGRKMIELWHEVPERVRKFQVGHEYRLPLWELVYHDCVVAQWYWGDYNNKLPALWDKRDLFNVLYGTPPMFMFRRSYWNERKLRFVESYRKTAPVARATGYTEMTDHRFLKPDRSVQQTRFANGVAVTVNFGEEPFRLPGGVKVEPMGSHVEGMK